MVAAEVIPRGVSGAELAAMEAGWQVLLSAEPLTLAELDDYASARGGLLFLYSARLLRHEGDEIVRRAGEAWALADLSRHIGSKSERDAALRACRDRLEQRRWPSRLRPLGMLAALAARDAQPDQAAPEPHGSPARMLRMLRHRLTGY